MNPIRSIILGKVLEVYPLKTWFPTVLLFVVAGLLSIRNDYKTEQLLVEKNRLKKETKELRSKSVTVEAELLNFTKVSVITAKCEAFNLGLERPNSYPTKIFIDE